MKFTLGWLKEHLETAAPLDEVVDKLTSLGLEVESVADPGEQLSAFVIGEVIECTRHPDADKLKVCRVDTGSETVQVVCGAPNARRGLKGVFAPAGTVVPGTGMHLKKAKIRGVESSGMLCSERELGLSDEHEGIIDLASDAPVGTPFAAFSGLDDPVIEIGITEGPNEPLSSTLGLANDHPLAYEVLGAGDRNDDRDRLVGLQRFEHLGRRLDGRERCLCSVRHRLLMWRRYSSGQCSSY